MIKYAILCGILLGLAGCGGSSNAVAPSKNPKQHNPPPVTVPAPSPLSSSPIIAVYGQSEAMAGEAVGFALLAKAGNRVKHISWQQLAGPSVIILAAHTQSIGFDVQEAGNYQFQVNGTMTNGAQFAQTVALSVQENTGDYSAIRLDQAVSEQANVSLRMATNSTKNISQKRWKQLAGTINVQLRDRESEVFFDAPEVTRDEIVVIEGTIEYTDGSTTSDVSLILIKDVLIDTDGYFPRYSSQVVTTDMFAYAHNSPYASALNACVYNNTVIDSCTFDQLPLIGQNNIIPSTAEIMDRVLVSHAWMGKRFEQFLKNSLTGEDMRKLLRATTAIVISYDIRPSFYWTATGAIYLDAANFWVTPQERDTLNSAPDYRAEFGNELQFSIPWRYIKDNSIYINNSGYPKNARLTKSFADMEANVSWLMYHELAHASDFFPPTSWSKVTSSDSPLGYANANEANSNQFSQRYPLTSPEMRSLARVSFLGDTASELQKSYNAQDVTRFFEPDNAAAYYSYSTVLEDYATLFERFMMLYRLGAQADTAVIELDDDKNYPVAWGQRNRINASKLRLRTQAVVAQILPEIDVQSAQQLLPGPQLFTPGVGYFEQVALPMQNLSTSNLRKRRMIDEQLFHNTFQHHIGQQITSESNSVGYKSK